MSKSLTMLVAGFLLVSGGILFSVSAQTFTDVTASSGLAAIISQNKTQNPTWWVGPGELSDLDGDGDLDLYIGAHGTSGAFAAYNNGSGVFTRTGCSMTAASNPELHITYDANEDGKLDAILTYIDGGAQWWTNQTSAANSIFTFASGITRPGNSSRLMAMVDINKDGKVDWIRFPQGNTFSFDLGNGTGGFTENNNQLTVNTGISNENFFFQPVDINGDGGMDLLGYTVAYTAVDGVSRVMQRGTGMTYTDVTASCGLSTATGYSIAGEADIDQDGDMDILMFEGRATLEAYINDGAGHFTKKTGAFTGTGSLSLALADGGVTMIDLDNDGIGDLVARGRSFFRIFRGTGGGNFTNVTTAAGITASGWTSPYFGDIDGDGDIDLMPVVDDGSHNYTFYTYRNDSPAKNWINIRSIGLAGNKGAAGAKIRVYQPGTTSLLWYEQVIIANHYTYYSFPETERHFGLGARATVDVEVEFYPSSTKVKGSGLAANKTWKIFENGTVSQMTVGIEGKVKDEAKVEEIQLEASPNPFTMATALQFTVHGTQSTVNLSIYNQGGKRVATLTNGAISSGSHTASWNAMAIPAGVYLARMQAGDKVLTKQILLLK